MHRAGRLVRDSCAGQCCGACSTVYQFQACCLGLPNAYVCSDAMCGSTPISEILRIVVDGQCYSRAPGTLPIPTGSGTILDGPDIDSCDHGGCSSPECVDACGNRYIPGELCAGQDYSGPPVFVFLQGPQSCGVLNVGGFCFKFDPSSTVPESEVPPGSLFMDPALLIDPLVTTCCACVAGCGETIQTVTECSGSGPVEVERRCCCTNRRTVTVSFESTVSYNPALSSTLTRDIEGTGLFQYDDSGALINQVPGSLLADVHETYSNQPDQDYTVGWAAPHSVCLPIPVLPYVGLAPFDWVYECGYNNNDGGNTGTVLLNAVRTCTNGLLSGTWTLRRNAGIPGDPLAGQIIAQGEYTSSISVQYFGRCSGGCGGSAGRSGVMVGRAAAGESVSGCAGCGGNGTGGLTL